MISFDKLWIRKIKEINITYYLKFHKNNDRVRGAIWWVRYTEWVKEEDDG